MLFITVFFLYAYYIIKSSKCANERLEDFFFLVLFFFLAKLFSSRNKIKKEKKSKFSLGKASLLIEKG